MSDDTVVSLPRLQRVFGFGLEEARVTPSVAIAGISHEWTPASLREGVHLAPEDAPLLRRDLAARGREAVALATCNRTEVYVAASAAAEAAESARQGLVQLGVGGHLFQGVYVRADEQAARHLFRVAAGLGSIVLGDTHVAPAVREAHHAAQQCGATGPILDRLFQFASRASKRVRTETSLSSGVTTIPGAAI